MFQFTPFLSLSPRLCSESYWRTWEKRGVEGPRKKKKGQSQLKKDTYVPTYPNGRGLGVLKAQGVVYGKSDTKNLEKLV